MIRAETLEEQRIAIERVINYMNHSILEPLSLPFLADIAGYSPYHFSRIFKRHIGTSPVHYFNSLRFQMSKELLLKTDLTIRDISLDIGQQSLGTFTKTFTERVGLTPSAFRASAFHYDALAKSIQKIQVQDTWSSKNTGSIISGVVTGPALSKEDIVLIGLFPKLVPEGMPVQIQLVDRSGLFQFSDIPIGVYYLKVVAIRQDMNALDVLIPQKTMGDKISKAFVVRQPFQRWEGVQLHLQSRKTVDLPILISLPLLIENYLNQNKLSNF